MRPIFSYLSILTNQFKDMDGWLCLVAAQGKDIEEYWMRPNSSLIKAEKWAKERNNDQKNIWASWALFKTRKRTKEQMAVTAAFVADWDDKHPEPRFIDGMQPSLTVSTSAGRWQHLYLHKPLELADADHTYKRLARAFGCDIGPSGDPVHSWRVPGTINWLNQVKRDKGRLPEPATWTVCHTVKLVDIQPYINAKEATKTAVADWPTDRKGKKMDRAWTARYNSKHVEDRSSEWNYLVLAMAEQGWGIEQITDKMTDWEYNKFEGREQQEVIRCIEKSAIEPPQENSTGKFKPTSFGNIEKVIETDDFVQGLLMEGSSVVVYGESNSGKTFWAIDLALHVASGKQWNGKRTTQGGVLYCALEGGIGFRNRVAAWREVHNPKGDVQFSALMQPMDLFSGPDDADSLIEAIKASPHKIKLLVIDTLARAMAGGNENLAEEMGALVGNVDRIRAETGACVMLIHHSGKDPTKGARGSNALRGAVDTEIFVAAMPDGTTHEASSVKQRDLAKGQKTEFRLPVHVLGKNKYGEEVTTCTVAGPRVFGHLMPLEAGFHPALKEAIIAHNAETTNQVTEAQWMDMSVEMSKMSDLGRASKNKFSAAKNAMVKAGWIVVHTDSGLIENVRL